jgi:hypothetical protein
MMRRITERDNFAYLTISLVVFLLLASLVHQFLDGGVGGRVLEAMLVLTLVTGVRSIWRERRLFVAGIGFTTAVLLVSLAGFFFDSQGVTLIHMVLLLGFFLLATWVAAEQVLFSGHVDRNAIVGAICLYLMIGMIWALLFMLVEELVPGSFKGLAGNGADANFMDLVYFSFVSLTTMGFGDITPTLPMARFLTYMEGIVGQFYLAILVASLIGARVANWQQK